MGEHNVGWAGLFSWLALNILGMFTAQSWSFLMAGLAALCTGAYYGAKAYEKITDIIEGRKRKEDEED